MPGWFRHLDTLQKDQGEEELLLVSLRAPGHSKREHGRWKILLAERDLGTKLAYLAKGHTDGWAIGLKMKTLPRERLEELAAITAEIFTSWYEAETN